MNYRKKIEFYTKTGVRRILQNKKRAQVAMPLAPIGMRTITTACGCLVRTPIENYSISHVIYFTVDVDQAQLLSNSQ